VKKVCAIAALLCALGGHAATPDASLAVRILYDNSGSMYPGYRPPGASGRQTREQLGVHFIYQLPDFAAWLDSLVARQSALGGETVGMWTFTSDGPFQPGDIQEVRPAVSLPAFRAEDAVSRFPHRPGNNTYLTETLTAFTRGFTGVVWLITDNIVETNGGQPDAGVQRFFETLAQSSEYRSVHLYKQSFRENGQTATLAVYGIVVSKDEIPNETLAHYDRVFRDLFPGSEHLKLKNLSIEPLTLHADLQLVVDDADRGELQEGQSVQLALQGEIRSHLTQHSVTSGRYELAIASPFVPEPWAQRDLGAQSISSEVFETADGKIDAEIPPNGTRRVQAVLRSTQGISFAPSGIVEWLRLAWNGAAVRYTANVRMSLDHVRVRLERQEMAGIFGIDRASSIFSFQDVTSLPGIRPTVVPVSLVLRTGSSRTAILLAVLALLLTIAGGAALVLTRKQAFRIAISGTPETLVALRRLGTHNVYCEGRLLGRLSRGLLAGYDFHPVPGDPGCTLVSNDGETWELKRSGAPNRRLSIKAEGGGRTPRKPKVARSRGAPSSPPPPIPMSRGGPPIGRPPKIGR
jgi:hypothetical protein